MRALRAASPDTGGDRRWLYVPYDQLTDEAGELARSDPGRTGVVLVETTWKAERRPYHKQKLALVLANQRHFALEQARRGVAVRYVASDRPYRDALAPVARELGPLTVMEPAERELRADLAPLVAEGLLRVAPHEGWLTDAATFASIPGPPWRMDAFYRHVRRGTGILMHGDSPVGGKFSFDAENRRPWKGEPPAPEPPRFHPDEVTREVGALVAERFAHHPGELHLESLPATRADAEQLWAWALESCLPWFGPYEDALSLRSRSLFHSRISALLNNLRLTPARVVADVVAADLPLPSKEGFVRQVIGWREFVRHVHVATDGFRSIDGRSVPVAEMPGDAGLSRWSGTDWRGSAELAGLDGGACPSALGARSALPPAFWGQRSGLECLDTVVRAVLDEGYTHHIARLMVLANLAQLLDVSPRELTDWFWAAFTDAYDWVVEPNVLGMGTFAADDVMTTKPYVSGAAYIHKMGDACADCRFDPRKDCPITGLYWAFLERKREQLEDNPRLAMPMRSAARRTPDKKARDHAVFEAVRRKLLEGGELAPEDL